MKGICRILCLVAALILACCTEDLANLVVPVEAVQISEVNLELIVGDQKLLTATVFPENATDKAIVWKSSKPSVASITDAGVVEALSEGLAIITASAGNVNGSCEVTVKKKVIPVESVTLSQKTLELTEEDEVILTATVLPENATDKSLEWTSSAPGIASVTASGLVKALAEGTATITASAGNVNGSCEVTVKKKIIHVESVTLDREELSMTVGEGFTLTATVLPDNATDKTVTWTSSVPEIASVENGYVFAFTPGQTVITASAEGKNDICVVKVTPQKIPVTTILLDYSELSMIVGDERELKATIVPEDATEKNVTWTSSNTLVATVTNGIVKAVKEGNTTIVAHADGQVATCSVTVDFIPVTNIELDRDAITMYIGDESQLLATVSPNNATYPTVFWTSSATDVAQVSGGTVTAVGKGIAEITARAEEKTALATITVLVPVGNVTLDRASVKLVVGNRVSLTASYLPEDATPKAAFVWQSSNPEVAGVSDAGVVTANSAGTAEITVQMDGKTASCAITVEATSGNNEGTEKEPWK